LKRAFGAAGNSTGCTTDAACPMKAYYDYTVPEHQTTKSPQFWAHAFSLIDLGYAIVGPGGSAPDPIAAARIDDLKQFWYYYYLRDTITGPVPTTSDAMKEFVWKGQMSYMTAMIMVTHNWFPGVNGYSAVGAAGTTWTGTGSPSYLRAHFTSDEVNNPTTGWWKKVKDHWPPPQHSFTAPGACLADGTPGAAVDQNDLVYVRQFIPPTTGVTGGSYNNALGSASVVTVAQPGDTVGFNLSFPGGQVPSTVPWGLSKWTPGGWVDVVPYDIGPQLFQYNAAWRYPNNIQVSYPSDGSQLERGVYRVNVGAPTTVVNGESVVTTTGSVLNSLNFNPVNLNVPAGRPFSYLDPLTGGGGKGIFYLPKEPPPGMASCNDGNPVRRPRYLEIANPIDYVQICAHLYVYLYSGLPSGTQALVGGPFDLLTPLPTPIDLSAYPGATFMTTQCGPQATFAVPYIFSAPNIWAHNFGELLVPRAVAIADGLTSVSGCSFTDPQCVR
jgi:hypothetical protein